MLGVNKMNIWIIDDNADLLELLKSSLGDLGNNGWHLQTFSCGKDVLNYSMGCHGIPEVVVLDWTLPDLPALHVLEHIGRQYRSARVVVISGNVDVQDQLPAHVHWLGKPFRLAVFRQLVSDLASQI